MTDPRSAKDLDDATLEEAADETSTDQAADGDHSDADPSDVDDTGDVDDSGDVEPAPADIRRDSTSDTLEAEELWDDADAVPPKTVIVERTVEVPPEKPSRFWSRLLKGLGALIVAGAVVAAGLLLWPEVEDRIIDPVETNTAETESLQTDLSAVNQRIQDLEGRTDDLETTQSDLVSTLDAVDAQILDHTDRLDDLDALTATVSEDAAYELSTLRAMELLSRARLFLYQSNFGLAASDVEAARAVLLELIDAAEAGETGIDVSNPEAAVERLDTVLASLPDRPVLAADDLDIAWALLLGETPTAPATTTTTTEAEPTTTETTVADDPATPADSSAEGDPGDPATPPTTEG